MKNGSGAERRRDPRIDLKTFCPTSFIYRGLVCEAMMVELSSSGARLQLTSRGGSSKPFPGSTIRAEVKTPYGPSRFEARVVWGQSQQEQYLCGIQFTSLSQDTSDPLRAFMDSVF